MSQKQNKKKQLDSPLEEPCYEDLVSLADGRQPKDFKTRYSVGAWFQISLELIYLLLMLLGSLFLLCVLLKFFIIKEEDSSFFPTIFGPYPESKLLLIWLCVALGGICGGCTTALKWLYHTVAKQHWHRDRLIWRLVVPILACVLAVFIGMIINSGLMPEGKIVLANRDSFLSKPTTAAAFGFFVGLFSDYALASLQNLARRIFGTTKD